MDVQEFKEIANLLECVIHKYVQKEKVQRDYGNGIYLSQPEMQTIMLIDSYPGISVSQIAKIRGITKGTVSQMLYKLVDKGLIEKRISEHSDAQLSIFLTELGKEESRLHDAYHREQVQPVYEYFSKLSNESIKDFIGAIKVLEKAIDESV